MRRGGLVAVIAAAGVSVLAAGPAENIAVAAGPAGEPAGLGRPGSAGEAPAAPAAGAPGELVPRVELVTMGQGEEIFEKFGHAALCVVYDQGKRTTICYNYGTTDFDAIVSLFWGFLRGRSVFWVSTSTRGRMISQYRAADRSVWRQILPLSPEQARELARLLRENARVENRTYRYHHYRDNCSSRLRDVIDRVTGGALSKTPDGGGAGEHPTFRELTRRGFAGDTGLLLLSDLVLGRVADARPSAYEAMFLPDVLRAEAQARFGAAPVLLHERRGPRFPDDPGSGGRWVWIALALVFAAPIAASRMAGRGERWALAASVAPLAFLGLVLWFLVAVTSLPELRWNEAVLVFVPLDALLPFLGPLWRVRYAAARIALLVLVALLLAVGVLRQPLWLLLPMPLLTMVLVTLPRRAPAIESLPTELAAE